MIGQTLSTYIALRFAKTVIAMMASLLVLIVVVDFVEQMRKAAERPEIPILQLLQLSALKAPFFMDKAFPFACLFAAMITLTQLNQRLELVVARAAGISAWQFLLPVSLAAVVIGFFAAFVYNPLAIIASDYSKDVEVRVFTGEDRMLQSEVSGYWLRQEDNGGSSVINARIARDAGKKLDDVKIIRFDEDGMIRERIDATSAQFTGQGWLLTNASVIGRDARAMLHDSYQIDSRLDAGTLLALPQIRIPCPSGNCGKWPPWRFAPAAIPNAYYTQFYSLLALPLFLIAMVIIAATVSLRFVRFGQVGRMILGGIAAGFVLYTVTKLVTSLGSNGIVPPIVAAWSPSVVAIVFGTSILLHQEDG